MFKKSNESIYCSWLFGEFKIKLLQRKQTFLNRQEMEKSHNSVKYDLCSKWTETCAYFLYPRSSQQTLGLLELPGNT